MRTTAQGRQSMREWELCGRFAARAGALTILLALAGCGEGPPPVSSTEAEAAGHGTGTFKGAPGGGGDIRFEPFNGQRWGGKTAAPADGKGWAFKGPPLQGSNMVRF